MKNPTIYEINTRVWCKEFELAGRGSRGLDAVPDEALDAIAAQGYDAVWLMGVWTTGEVGRSEALQLNKEYYSRALPNWAPDDVISSPYAVVQYAVTERLGGDDALDRLRQRLKQRGLALILDVVPNHTARDHPWVREHPERYVSVEPHEMEHKSSLFFPSPDGQRKIAFGGAFHEFCVWTDTAQLDYRNPQTRDAMCELLASLADRCDGLRCDMSNFLLGRVFHEIWQHVPARVQPAEGEFWAQATAAVRRGHPDFLMIAEAYEILPGELAALGFDYVYDKGIYDFILERKLPELDAAIGDKQQRLQIGLHFLENHDEKRAAQVIPSERYQVSAVIALTLPGARIIHEGQERGARVQLPVQLGRRPRENRDDAIADFYDALLPVITSNTLRHGQWRRLKPRFESDSTASPEPPAVFAWQWQRGTEGSVVCVANLSDASATVRLRLETPHLAGRETMWKDVVSGESRSCHGEELVGAGLRLELGGFATQVLVLQ